MWFLIIEMSVVSWIICPFCSVFSVFNISIRSTSSWFDLIR